MATREIAADEADDKQTDRLERLAAAPALRAARLAFFLLLFVFHNDLLFK
jgi:hypothetical protein